MSRALHTVSAPVRLLRAHLAEMRAEIQEWHADPAPTTSPVPIQRER